MVQEALKSPLPLKTFFIGCRACPDENTDVSAKPSSNPQKEIVLGVAQGNTVPLTAMLETSSRQTEDGRGLNG